MERSASGVWSPETVFASYVGVGFEWTVAPVLTVDADDGNLYVAWSVQDKILLLRREADVWGDIPIDLFTGEGTFYDGGGNTTPIKAFLQKWDRYMGFTWLGNASSPYNLRFATYVVLPAELKTAPHAL